MTVRDTPWPAGTPCWVDLAVPDVIAATAFYGRVLGWSFVDTGEAFDHQHVAEVDGRAAASIGPAVGDDGPSAWVVYLATDDADATAELVVEHGGALRRGPVDVPGARTAAASDPTGGAFGIWQAAGRIGFAVANEPGAVTWTDARLSDVARGKEFLTAVFGHALEPVPDAPDGYATLLVDGEPVGGVVGTPEGIASHWLTYFSVADVDATAAVAARSGATVLMPAEDTPFGRMAILTDPFGATFAVHRAPEEE